LDELDLAAGGEEAELVEETGAEVLGEFEGAEEGGVVDRAVVGRGEDFEEAGAEIHGNVLNLTTEGTEGHGGKE
jgi:hypothetical protein